MYHMKELNIPNNYVHLQYVGYVDDSLWLQSLTLDSQTSEKPKSTAATLVHVHLHASVTGTSVAVQFQQITTQAGAQKT